MLIKEQAAAYIMDNLMVEFVEDDGGYPLLVLRETRGRECCEEDCISKAEQAVFDPEDEQPFGHPFCDDHAALMLAAMHVTEGLKPNTTQEPNEIAYLWAESNAALFVEGQQQ